MIGDEVAERAVLVPGTRMHHESRRLVDHEQVVVFVGDRKRAGLRFDGALVSPRFVVDDDAEDLPRPHDLVGFAANAVECDAVVSSLARRTVASLTSMVRRSTASTVSPSREGSTARASVRGCVVDSAVLMRVSPFLVSTGAARAVPCSCCRGRDYTARRRGGPSRPARSSPLARRRRQPASASVPAPVRGVAETLCQTPVDLCDNGAWKEAAHDRIFPHRP